MSLKRLLLGLFVAVGGLITLIRSALPPSPPAPSNAAHPPRPADSMITGLGLQRPTPRALVVPKGIPSAQTSGSSTSRFGLKPHPTGSPLAKLVLSRLHRSPRTLLIRPTSRPLHPGQPFLAPGFKPSLGAASRPAILPKPVCDIVVLVEGMT